MNEFEQILKIYEANAQKEREELLNRIASKLKIEYLDFESAKDMPMSIELGENLREQIDTIFKILDKNGIKIK